jgi:ubiquitin carboxyl-terminal hydrolase 47
LQVEASASASEIVVETLETTLTLEKAALPSSGNMLKLALRRKDGIELIREPLPPPPPLLEAPAADGPLEKGWKKDSGMNKAVTIESAAGYVGLANQGATCYMNSVLQSLYMTPEFRHAIFSWNAQDIVEAKKASLTDVEATMTFQLQRLFLRLHTAEKRSADTKDLTKSFGWNERDAFQQHDVQELCYVLFDALEAQFAHTSLKGFVAKWYEGTMKDYVQCKKCWNENARHDKFTDISLVIRPFGATTAAFDSLEAALEAFVQPELLSGDSQYFCEKCACKVDALKGLKIEKFPPILTFQLKRFDFDYQTMRRVKLTDCVSFPFTLDSAEFLPSGKIARRASLAKKNLALINTDSDANDVPASPLSPAADELSFSTASQYELFSVMVHSGSATGGHYYAYIKDIGTQRWFKFNDSFVSAATEDEVREAFGKQVLVLAEYCGTGLAPG